MSDEISDNKVDIASRARAILRQTFKGALGTVNVKSDFPHVSLVLCATDPAGAPLLLLSGLARHTQNITANDHVGLMLDDTLGLDEPLTGGRLSLTGRIEACDDGICRQRFLNRHESASLYADFGDFAFYRLDICDCLFVGGFGAIHDLGPGELLIPAPDAGALIKDETDIIAHMNLDHRDVISLIATALNGAEAGAWRLTGVDGEGCDLIWGHRTVRQNFFETIESGEGARAAFIQLTELARRGG